MTAFDMWPFTDVHTVERRGDLDVLSGMSPDGLPVTITRVAPDAARDGDRRRRFRDAVETATRRATADDPPILWADTATLVPWAATYDDAAHRGADLIAGIYESGELATGGAPGAAASTTAQPPEEKSVPALDPESLARYQTLQPGYEAPPYDAPGQGPPPSGPGLPQAPGHRAPGGGSSARTPLMVGLGIGGLVLVLLLGSLIAVGLSRKNESVEAGATSSTYQAPQTATAHISTGPESPSPTPGESSSATASPRPTLRAVKPMPVVGPMWSSKDSTFTMAFSQFGWAFRAPHNYNCFMGTDTEIKRKVVCWGPKPGGRKQASDGLSLVVQQCAKNTCTAAEKKLYDTDPWGRPVKHAKTKDATTKYESKTNTDKQDGGRKYYVEWIGHYYVRGGHMYHISAAGDAP
ncbi:MAG: hypothetical protein J2P14_07980, partial [Acidothermales bacterium]|nr:hypothetical protein [Acidothermales bacterium]